MKEVGNKEKIASVHLSCTKSAGCNGLLGSMKKEKEGEDETEVVGKGEETLGEGRA